jgi:hypothetical protein
LVYFLLYTLVHKQPLVPAKGSQFQNGSAPFLVPGQRVKGYIIVDMRIKQSYLYHVSKRHFHIQPATLHSATQGEHAKSGIGVHTPEKHELPFYPAITVLLQETIQAFFSQAMLCYHFTFSQATACSGASETVG